MSPRLFQLAVLCDSQYLFCHLIYYSQSHSDDSRVHAKCSMSCIALAQARPTMSCIHIICEHACMHVLSVCLCEKLIMNANVFTVMEFLMNLFTCLAPVLFTGVSTPSQGVTE